MLPGALPPVLYGKLPDRADFVRHGESPALDALDTVAQRALWPPVGPGDGPLYRFVYAPPVGEHVLAGALQLSHDRVGRRYPLVAARPLDRRTLDAAEAPSWPLRWNALFDAAAVAVRGAVAGQAPLADVAARVAALPDEGDAFDVARHALAASALSAPDWFGRLPGGTERALLMLGRLGDALGATVPRYGLRATLPAPAADFGRADAVAFWLAAGAHLLSGRAPWPSLFWSDDADAPGALFVFYGGLAPLALRSVLIGAADPAAVVALDARPDVSAVPPRRAGTPALARLLAAPGTSLADVLARVHTLR